MALSEMTPPQRTRTPKYQYSAEDVAAALKMLGEDKNPGDNGFETAGQARAAANALVTQMGEDGATIGSRVWGNDDEGYSFALKVGRRKYATGNQQQQQTEPQKGGGKRK